MKKLSFRERAHGLFLNWKTCCFLIVALTIITYVNVINGPFLWDDIGKSELMQSLFGTNVLAYHTVNIILHALNGCLVYGIFRKLSFKVLWGLLAALIFVVHPVQVESVAYIAGLPYVLGAFFVLLGVNLYLGVGNLSKHWWKFVGVAVLFALSILVEESNVMFPGLIALLTIYGWRHFGKKDKKARFLGIGILIALSLTYIGLRFAPLGFMEADHFLGVNPYTESLYVRFVTFLSVIPEYLRLLFAPVDLHFEKSFEYYENILSLRAIVGALVLIGMGVASYFSWKRSKKVFLGILWTLVAISPMAGLTVLNATYAERWLYIPLVGILIALFALTKSVRKRKQVRALSIVLVILIVVFSARSISRNSEWADPIKFYEKELVYTPNSPRLYNQLSIALIRNGELEKAISYLERGIEIDSSGMSAALRHNLGDSYMQMENYADAIEAYLNALEIRPNNLQSHKALHDIFAGAGDPEITRIFERFIKRIESGEIVTVEEIKLLR